MFIAAELVDFKRPRPSKNINFYNENKAIRYKFRHFFKN